MADDRQIERAVAMLRGGGLVAFPTDTVYGLGAGAENENAVRKVFAVKGRPEGYPLIVHLADPKQLADWAVEIPNLAWRLAERFWPGPLTLILRRHRRIPDVVTGGLETVGLRIPNHPMALALLRSFRGGIAAPSANRFGSVSPTTATHVLDSLGDVVDLILDGGKCPVGIESTILDLSTGPPAILRPGGVPRESLEEVAGRPVPVREGEPVRNPGQLPRHYAPRARVAIGRVRAIAVVVHDQCAMLDVASQRDQFVSGLVENGGWDRGEAEEHVAVCAPVIQIEDPPGFATQQSRHLRKRFPKLLVAYSVSDGMLRQVRKP